MADQYLALYEETTRGTAPVAPSYHFLPVRGALRPSFEATDESRKEFRGPNSALGDAGSSLVRRGSAWNHSLECAFYPGAEVGLLLKHALGHAGTRATVDTSAKRGILYPVPMPYGAGASLDETAVALVPNTDEGGVTKSRAFGGGRCRSLGIAIKSPDDVVLTFDLGGAGPWVGAEDEAVAGLALPPVEPFLAAQALCYIGAGASRTGTAPDFTEIGPGTMQLFRPDELNIKVSLGLEDETVLNGILGPSETKRTGQVQVEVDFTIDYADPASGFSSAAEVKKMFTGPNLVPLMVVLDLGILAGAATANYRAVIDIPQLLLKADTPEDNTDGKTPQVKFSGTHKIDVAIGYPLAILTTDQAAAY